MIETIVYRPIQADLSRVEATIAKVEARQVTRDEHEGRWRQQDREHEFTRARLSLIEERGNRRIERLEERVFAKP